MKDRPTNTDNIMNNNAIHSTVTGDHYTLYLIDLHNLSLYFRITIIAFDFYYRFFVHFMLEKDLYKDLISDSNNSLYFGKMWSLKSFCIIFWFIKSLMFATQW